MCIFWYVGIPKMFVVWVLLGWGCIAGKADSIYDLSLDKANNDSPLEPAPGNSSD
jgi:hypothetical protein